jgi:lipopolysaccharide/colanic/teichoic acid biosynthesis glycosyltransferase
VYRRVKRLTDVIFSLVLLCALVPVFIPIMLILAVTGEREVFYLQERVGHKNKSFFIWKFATMLKNSPNIGNKGLTVRNDPRVTGFGKFLRQTKLNELPQLINVLRGEMSLIGPRPLMPVGFQRFSTDVQRSIYSIHPGITGIGSVIFRDEEAFVTNCSDYEAAYVFINHCKGELEQWYRDHMSLTTDFLIFFLTLMSIINPKNTFPYSVFKDLPKSWLLRDKKEFNRSKTLNFIY